MMVEGEGLHVADGSGPTVLNHHGFGVDKP